jgi:hypothetical protein
MERPRVELHLHCTYGNSVAQINTAITSLSPFTPFTHFQPIFLLLNIAMKGEIYISESLPYK